MKIIEVIVTPQGKTEIETIGFSSNECVYASRFLESALGKTVDDRPTPEFFTSNPCRQTIVVKPTAK